MKYNISRLERVFKLYPNMPINNVSSKLLEGKSVGSFDSFELALGINFEIEKCKNFNESMKKATINLLNNKAYYSNLLQLKEATPEEMKASPEEIKKILAKYNLTPKDIEQANKKFAGKRVKVKGKGGGKFIQVGINPLMPKWGLVVLIDRMPVQIKSLNDIEIIEKPLTVVNNGSKEIN